MGNAARQSPETLHFLRLQQLSLQLLALADGLPELRRFFRATLFELGVEPRQFLFGSFAFGEIANNRRETHQRAIIVHEGGDHEVGPKPGTVFAEPPALFLVATLGARLS